MINAKPVYKKVIDNFVNHIPSKFIVVDSTYHGKFSLCIKCNMEYPIDISGLDCIKIHLNMFSVHTWGLKPQQNGTIHRVDFDGNWTYLRLWGRGDGTITRFYIEDVEHLSCRFDVTKKIENKIFNFSFFVKEGDCIFVSKYLVNEAMQLKNEGNFTFPQGTLAYDVILAFTKALIASHRLTYSDLEWNSAERLTT